jgi:Domain of unknown function (DUF4424)
LTILHDRRQLGRGQKADFTLTVDKGESVNLVSFFGEVLTKIAAAQFQMHYTNFAATANLTILVSGAKPVGFAPCSSEVALFGYGESVVDLNAEVAHRALNLLVPNRSCTAHRPPVRR